MALKADTLILTSCGAIPKPVIAETRPLLVTDRPVVAHRISPFSTPPSSDDSQNADTASPKILSQLRQGIRAPVKSSDVANSKVSRGELPQPSESLSVGNSSILNGSNQDYNGRRPDLPPRPHSGSLAILAPPPKLPTRVSGHASRDEPRVKRSDSKPQTKDVDQQQWQPNHHTSLEHSSGFVHRPAQTRVPGSDESLPNHLLYTQAPRSPVPYTITVQSLPGQGRHGNPTPAQIKESSEFPDSSSPNRRPPCTKAGVHIIHTIHDTGSFEMGAGLACCAGQLIRVWDLTSGRLVMSLVLGEKEVRATAQAFKPGTTTSEEGSRLWIGTNYGDLQEISVSTQKVVSLRLNVHNGRPIVRILRYQNTMWTLDEDGTLLVWPPSKNGLPSLEGSPIVNKIPRGHTFSMIVRGILWLAVGRAIRIFRPSASGIEELSQGLEHSSQSGAGEITSGAVVGDQLDKVYFGHSDGKISVYSVLDYTCLGVVNVSVYKINCLAGAGNHLWAGYNTGKVCVYDTQTSPWEVIKDWHAHEGPVTRLSVDRSSLWMSGLLQVGTVSLDNTIRLWDGLLEDDWLQYDLRRKDTSWCEFREIEAVVMTWNAGASTPSSLRYEEKDPNILRIILPGNKAPDLLVFGFQELVDLEDKRLTAKTLFKGSKRKDANDHDHMGRQYRDWRDHLVRSVEEYMPPSEAYVLLHTASMVGLFSCVFIKASLRSNISRIEAAEIKRGMGGLHGNKGALILRFHFNDSSICLINCHLAAGQTNTMHRNSDITAILDSFALPPKKNPTSCCDSYVGGGDGSMILDHEICILNGDLNYRIDTMSRDVVIKAIRSGNLDKLLERDQLLVSRRKNPVFGLKSFAECPINFEPTYKYDVGSDNYDSSEKNRAPAWCDRILYRGPGKIKQLDYQRHDLRVSDHRPVTATFRVRVKSVISEKRQRAWEQCQRHFESVKQKLADEAKMRIFSKPRPKLLGSTKWDCKRT
ncbi:MAG: hypothetical protein Q9218_001942 [Villophora microphyllina]